MSFSQPGPALGEWPEGCLGYLVNCLASARKGLREKLFFTLFKDALVFRTEELAWRYRSFVVSEAQGLGGRCPTIFTLDGQCIESAGFEESRKHAPPFRPLEDCEIVIGSLGWVVTRDPCPV